MSVLLPVEVLYANSRLTSAQLAIWLGLKLHPDKPILDAAALYYLPHGARIDCFQTAFQEFVDTSDAFRMVVIEEDGVPQPRILDPFRYEMEVIDFTSAENPKDAAKAWAREQSLHVFDLTKPMFHAKLIKLGTDIFAWFLHVNHLITDAYSSVLTIQRLNNLYRLAVDGKLDQSPEFPQFADHAKEEYESRLARPPAEELAFWRTKLARRLEPPSFYGRTRKSSDTALTTRGQLLGTEITQQLIGMLDDERISGKKPEATLFNLFATALYALMYRISGARDLAIGTMYHNRRTDDARDTIGVYVGALPLRTRIEEGETFLSLAQKVRAEAVENRRNVNGVFRMSLDYGDYDVMLNVHVAQPVGLLGYEDELPYWVRSGHGRETLVVHAFFIPQRGDYWVIFDTNDSVFDDYFRERVTLHFKNMIAALVHDLDSEIDEVDLLEECERDRLLHQYNDSARQFADNTTACALIEVQAQNRPNAPAVEHCGNVLTYGALDSRSNQLARCLQVRGVAHEELVGICMKRSPAMVVAALGVMKAGAAYVPIDITYPPERLAYMLRDSGVRKIIVAEDAGNLSILGDFEGEIVAVDLVGNLAEAYSGDPVQSQAGPGSLAYVIYTSGSTGWPKGTMIEHRGLCNLMQMQADFFEVTPASRVLQFASFSFDASVSEIFVTLGAGATLCIPPDDILLDTGALSAFIQENRVSVVTLPPALLRLMNPADSRSLRTVVSAGDRCSSDVVNLWASGRRFVNGYGPTESTVCAAMAECEAGAIDAPPIGRAPDNTQLYVLDKRNNLVPIGTPGELYIGGVGLARGYLGQPELTAQRFVAHPFDSTPGARVYKTGDLVRYRPDGQLEFIGRVDRQVKIHGFRIEPGEIESALESHGSVHTAIVDTRDDGRGEPKLVAYIKTANDDQPSVSELRNFVAGRVPRYMVPSIYVFLDEIPLNANGKIDRAALPVPSIQSGAVDQMELPQSDVEKRLAEIWCKVLHVDSIGVHDNFFEHGGDSIGCIQIAGTAREAGLTISPNHIFEHPTIAALAAAMSSGLKTFAEQGVVTGAVPLTPIQHWFFALQNPNPSHWNQSVVLEAVDSIDLDVLSFAVAALIDHHDMMRARFRIENGAWTQRIVEHAGVAPILVFDLSATPRSDLAIKQRECVAQVQASLDIERGPVLRFGVLKTGNDQRDIVVVAVHHLVVDAVSWRAILDDLDRAYELAFRGKPISFPPKTTSYKHWANRLRAIADDAGLRADFDYWRKRRRVPRLPSENRGQNTVASSDSLVVSLYSSKAAALSDGSQYGHGAQLLDVMLVALAEALSEWTKQKHVSINLELHGRDHAFDDVDLSRTAGWFTSVFPVHIALGDEQDAAASFQNISEQIHEARRHGQSYGLLRHVAGNAHTNSELMPPLADVSLNYMGTLDRLAAPGKWFTPNSPMDGTRSNYCLDSIRPCGIEVNGYSDSEGVHFHWTFSEHLHNKATIEGVATGFVDRLESLLGALDKVPTRAPAAIASFNFAEMGTMIPIKPSGSRPPFFCVPGGGGVVFPFYNLVPYVDPDQPIYGLQDPSLDESVEPFKRVEDLAAFYLERMRSVQPRGPYYLGGWSFGGAVAFEIAQQARRAGDEVGFVAIMDQLAPPLLEKRGTLAQRLSKIPPAIAVISRTITGSFPYVRDGLYLVFSRDKGDGNGLGTRATLMDYFTWAWRDALFKSFLQQADIARVAVADSHYVKFKQPATRRVMFVLRAHTQALKRYRAQPYPGVVDVFRSADDWAGLKLDKEKDLGWGALAKGGALVHTNTGSHVSLMRKPYVIEFSRNLNRRLRETQPGYVDVELDAVNNVRPA